MLVATVINDVVVQGDIGRASFQTRHAVIHLLGYGLLAILTLRASDETPGLNRRTLLIVGGLMLLVGLGQETLQMIQRGYFSRPINSLLDLLTDAVGGLFATWLYLRPHGKQRNDPQIAD